MLKIEITNDETGTERSANYNYTVRINDRVIEAGTIKGHNRSDGWRYLVTLVGTPIKFRSAIPLGVKVESHLTQDAADLAVRSANDEDFLNEKLCAVCGHSESRHQTAGGFCKHCPCIEFVDHTTYAKPLI